MDNVRRKVTKRRNCSACGRAIPKDKIEVAYLTGNLLRCTSCGVMTSAVEVDEVAGNLVVRNGKICLYKELPRNQKRDA